MTSTTRPPWGPTGYVPEQLAPGMQLCSARVPLAYEIVRVLPHADGSCYVAMVRIGEDAPRGSAHIPGAYRTDGTWRGIAGEELYVRPAAAPPRAPLAPDLPVHPFAVPDAAIHDAQRRAARPARRARPVPAEQVALFAGGLG